jgi:polygalacturonase
MLMLLLASLLAAAKEEDRIYNVRNFGASGDGRTLDTRAIQKAIDRCSTSGGTVLLPAGTYLSGTIRLKSRVTLHVSEGATLLGSSTLSDYPEIVGGIASYNDLFLRHSLLYAENEQDIAITGPGTIDGQGGRFPVANMEKPHRYKNRPYILRMINCKNVRVENLKMQNSAMWMQHYLGCENLTLRGLTVYNHCNKNNDMVDVDGCRNVLISDCIADTDDDAITLKSTSAMACENIAIDNCIVSSHCNAVKCGTESIGGFKNIVISNIVITPSRHPQKIAGDMAGLGGIVLTLVDGGCLSGVTISNVRIVGTRVPIFIRLGDRGRTVRPDMPKAATGTVENISISHVLATGVGSIGCSITGLPGHMAKNIHLSDIHIQFAGGVATADSLWQVAEKPEEYPESTLFGTLPSYGLFCRHVQGLSLRGIRFDLAEPDARPALIADDVEDLFLDAAQVAVDSATSHACELRNVRQAFLSGLYITEPIPLLAKITGPASADIQWGVVARARIGRVYTLGDGAAATAVSYENH